MLEVSRLARGLIALEAQYLDLRELGRRAIESRRAEADRAGLSLGVAVPAGPVWVRADAARLRRVADGLLENALKFTGRGGAITLEVASDADSGQAVLAVRDNGLGIAPEVLQRMLEALARPDGGLDVGQGGLGLGLALARGIIDLHGGIGTGPQRRDGPWRGVHRPAAPGRAGGPGAGR